MRFIVFLALIVVIFVVSCSSCVGAGDNIYDRTEIRRLRGDDNGLEERVMPESISSLLKQAKGLLPNAEVLQRFFYRNSEEPAAKVASLNAKEAGETIGHEKSAATPLKEVEADAAHENAVAVKSAPILEEAAKTANAPVKEEFKSATTVADDIVPVAHGKHSETELTKKLETLSPAEKKMMEENHIDLKLLSERHPETVAKVFALAVNGARSQKSMFIKVFQWTLAAVGAAAVLYILFHWITASAKPMPTVGTITAGGA